MLHEKRPALAATCEPGADASEGKMKNSTTPREVPL
jgi:hypothetical protein